MSGYENMAERIRGIRHQMRVLSDHYPPSHDEKRQRPEVHDPQGTINRYIVAERHLRELQAKREHATWIYAAQGLPRGYPFSYVPGLSK